MEIQETWAELRRLPSPPRGLADRIARAIELYPCELLFVHRDAEGSDRDVRVREIAAAVSEADLQTALAPHVCVVPVRMTEAWMLFHEGAIRSAAGNPNGTVPLQLPGGNIEALNDPKTILHQLLQTACELTGRHLRRFRCAKRAFDVTRHIDDFGPLRNLAAFRAMEEELRSVLEARGWSS